MAESPHDPPRAGQAPKPRVSGALPPGTALRQYVIVDVIGTGGFGITYRATHQTLTSKVFCIKEYFPRAHAMRVSGQIVPGSDGEEVFALGLSRFLAEAEALARCVHPSIVGVVDYFEENGTAYSVLDYVEGQQLGQWLEQLGRPPTQQEIDNLLAPLLLALESVHAQNLLHRDISPDNILVRPDGSPCLIDFGAARAGNASRRTVAIVKDGYSPPEQYAGDGGNQGPWTDIYALGALLTRAITGKAPPDSMRRRGMDPQISLLDGTKGISYRSAFLRAVDWAMQLDHDQRPASVEQWREMLFDRSGEATTVAKPQPTEIDWKPAETPGVVATGRKRIGATVLSAVLLSLVVLGATYFWISRPATQVPAIATPKAIAKAPSTTIPGPATTASSPERLEPPPVAPQATITAPPAAPRPTIQEMPHAPPKSATESQTDAAVAVNERPQEPIPLPTPLRTETPAPPATPSQKPDNSDLDLASCRSTTLDRALRIAACTRLTERSDISREMRVDAYLNRGRARRDEGNPDSAINDYDAALKLAPENSTVHNDLGIAHYDKGDIPGALAEFDAAVRYDPGNGEALNNRAWAEYRRGQSARGLVDADRAVALIGGKAYAWDTRGHINEALGNRDAAIRDYRKALELDPSSAASSEGLKRLGVAP